MPFTHIDWTSYQWAQIKSRVFFSFMGKNKKDPTQMEALCRRRRASKIYLWLQRCYRDLLSVWRAGVRISVRIAMLGLCFKSWPITETSMIVKGHGLELADVFRCSTGVGCKWTRITCPSDANKTVYNEWNSGEDVTIRSQQVSVPRKKRVIKIRLHIKAQNFRPHILTFSVFAWINKSIRTIYWWNVKKTEVKLLGITQNILT